MGNTTSYNFIIHYKLKKIVLKNNIFNLTGVLDGYHINPLEESDMTDRSRISMLSTEMLEAKQIGVRGLSCYGFRLLDGTFL